MAGDWIPYTKDLPHKLEVIQIATATGRSRHEVVALLLEFWSWADSQTEDGELPGVTLDSLSSLVVTSDGHFWRQVSEAGWIEVTEVGVRIPNFTLWMSCSAKKRLRNTRSQQKSRAKKGGQSPPQSTGVTSGGDTAMTKTLITEQNRTEQEEIPPPPLPGGGRVPGQESENPGSGDAPPPAAPRPDPARRMASDRPDLDGEARAIAQLYDRLVGTYHGPAGGKAAAFELLTQNVDAQRIRAAVKHYGQWCEQNRVEPKARKAAGRFFRDGVWEDYAEGVPTPPGLPGGPQRLPEPLTLEESRARDLEAARAFQAAKRAKQNREVAGG